MPSFDESIKLKSGHKYGRLQQYEALAPWQLDLLKQISKHPDVSLPQTAKSPLYQGGSSYLQSLLSQDPEMMRQFEAPYMRQFQEETIPQLAERFSGLGAQNSSAFQQSLGQAGASLSERLAALRSGLGLQASQQALGYAQLPFQEALSGQGLGLSRAQLALGTQPFGYASIPGREREPGFLKSMLPGLAEGAGKSLSSGLFGGLGSALSSGISSLFSF